MAPQGNTNEDSSPDCSTRSISKLKKIVKTLACWREAMAITTFKRKFFVDWVKNYYKFIFEEASFRRFLPLFSSAIMLKELICFLNEFFLDLFE